jgi:hypothetical protein
MSGILYLDYVSPLRPIDTAMPMEEHDFKAFLDEYILQRIPDDPDEGTGGNGQTGMSPSMRRGVRLGVLESVTNSTDHKNVEKDELRSIFQMVDDDKNGTIDMRELNVAMVSVGFEPSASDLQVLVNFVDKDDSGEIDFEEFAVLWRVFERTLHTRDKMAILRKHSSTIFLSASQAADCLDALVDRKERLEAFVIFYARIIDEENMNLCLAKFSTEERHKLTHRLGSINLLNPYHPEGSYRLDLAQRDKRFVAQVMISLAMNEKGRCLYDEWYSKYSTSGMAFQLPRSWLEEVPHEGIYSFVYSSRTPHLDHRRRIAEDVLGWRFQPPPSVLDQMASG